MKKIIFALSFFVFFSCSDDSEKFEHIQTVVNNSSTAVSFKNDQNSDILSVNAGETKSVGFYSGNTLPVLTLDNSTYPRISVSSQYREPKVFEKIYTVTDCTGISVTFKNLSGKNIVIYGNYLGENYRKDGIEIAKDEDKTIIAYKTETYKAKIKDEETSLTVSQAKDKDDKAIENTYIIK